MNYSHAFQLDSSADNDINPSVAIASSTPSSLYNSNIRRKEGTKIDSASTLAMKNYNNKSYPATNGLSSHLPPSSSIFYHNPSTAPGAGAGILLGSLSLQNQSHPHNYSNFSSSTTTASSPHTRLTSGTATSASSTVLGSLSTIGGSSQKQQLIQQPAQDLRKVSRLPPLLRVAPPPLPPATTKHIHHQHQSIKPVSTTIPAITSTTTNNNIYNNQKICNNGCEINDSVDYKIIRNDHREIHPSAQQRQQQLPAAHLNNNIDHYDYNNNSDCQLSKDSLQYQPLLLTSLPTSPSLHIEQPRGSVIPSTARVSSGQSRPSSTGSHHKNQQEPAINIFQAPGTRVINAPTTRVPASSSSVNVPLSPTTTGAFSIGSKPPASNFVGAGVMSRSSIGGKSNQNGASGVVPTNMRLRNSTLAMEDTARTYSSSNSSYTRDNVNINFNVPPSPLLRNHHYNTSSHPSREMKGGVTRGLLQNSSPLTPIRSVGAGGHNSTSSSTKSGQGSVMKSYVSEKPITTARGRPSYSIEFEQVKKSVLQDDGIDIAEHDAVSDEERARRRSQRKAALRRLSEMTRGAFSSEGSSEISIDSDDKWEVTGNSHVPSETLNIMMSPTTKLSRTINREHTNRVMSSKSDTDDTINSSVDSSGDLAVESSAPPLLSILHVGGRYMTRSDALDSPYGRARDGRCTLNGRVKMTIYDPSTDIKNGLLETKAIELRTEGPCTKRRLRRLRRSSLRDYGRG